MTDLDPALADFRDLVRLGLARGGHLLTAGEHLVSERMLALEGPPAVLYARLTGRVRGAFRLGALLVPGVPDVVAAARVLCEAELADGLVPPSVRAACSTRSRLAEACRVLGLPVSGRKDQLVERLAAHPRWDGEPWLRIRHRGLVRRLEQWALLDAFPDRGMVVAARIGVVRWPPYTPTTGRALFADRRRLRAWEGLLAEPLDPERALAALRDATGRGPGRLDLGRALVRVVKDAAAAAERGDPDRAAALYGALARVGAVRTEAIAVRWARAEERAGRPVEAMRILRDARLGDARPSEHVAIARAGRRLGRALRIGLPPAPPLDRPRHRSVRLIPAEPVEVAELGSAAGDRSGGPALVGGVAPTAAPPKPRGRPRWVGLEGPRYVEDAVIERLAASGRRAVRAEAAPWTTLFAVLCAELYFLPIDGALPVPFLSGPLDLGTPGFRSARREACDALLAEIDAGGGPDRVRRADPTWRGTRLAGARWESAEPELLEALARGVGPRGLRVLIEALLDHGPRAAAGLPDLVVLPGPEVRLEHAHPSRVPDALLLVEVKGPGDVVRDEQIVWHDRLARAKVAVELWEISPLVGSGRGAAGLR